MSDSTTSGRVSTSAGEERNESALSRWSRLKNRAKDEKSTLSSGDGKGVIPEENGRIEEKSLSRSTVNAAGDSAASIVDEPTGKEMGLPSLSDVSLEKDFTPFMQAKVPEVLRRQALKALFKDAHFNTMDGLDIYIDDYTRFEPISAEDLEKLSAWQSIKNPLQQVVTPGGYAVDVNSEEGKAVLAAREALELGERAPDQAAIATNSGGQAPDAVTGVTNETVSSSASDKVSSVAEPGTHARFGKRVGDFKIDIEPLNEPAALTATDRLSPTAVDALDPR